MTENKEPDLSSINEWIWILKQRFTKLSEWLKIEKKKEMEEKGKLSESKKLIDEMEEVAKEIIDELEKKDIITSLS